MSNIEFAEGILDLNEATYGMTVYEDDTGFCTRLVLMKGDVPYGFVIHHGPNPEYSGKIPPLFVPSDGEPAGMMLEESERHRQDLHWYNKAKEQLEQSTLFEDAIKQHEDALEWIHNKSTFGPGGRTERNGYSHESTVREWFDTRAERTGKRQFKV